MTSTGAQVVPVIAGLALVSARANTAGHSSTVIAVAVVRRASSSNQRVSAVAGAARFAADVADVGLNSVGALAGIGDAHAVAERIARVA